MPDPATNSSNKELRLLTASVLYFLSRAAVVGFVFAVPAVYFLRGFVEMPMVLGGAGLVAFLFGAYYLVASGLRCGACSNPVLMDNGTRKHPHAKRIPGLSFRARVAWDILFHTNYLCMYCNTRCRCRKNWSGSSPQPAFPGGGRSAPVSSAAAAGGFPESVFSSIFGGVSVGDSREKSSTGRFPGVADEEEIEDSEESPIMAAVTERLVNAVPVTGKGGPAVRTVPVTLDSPETHNPAKIKTEQASEGATISAAVEVPADVRPSSQQPLPWETPAPRRPGNAAATARAQLKTAPGPQPVPETGKDHYTNEIPAMNESQHDRSSAALPSNPFLAAAAAQPPPPSPGLPARKATRSNGEEAPRAPAFPSANLAEPEDGPPPWTLPSAHRPAPVITAPVLPVIPDTAASLARRPQMTTSPSPVRPSTPAAPPAKVEAAPAAGAAPSAPGPMTPALIRDVVEVLEEGQRSLSAAFQSIIQKLENHLSADVPAAVPAPVAIPAVAADTAPVLPPAAAPPPAIERASVAPPPDFELSAAFPPPPPPGQGPLPPVMAPQPVAVPQREVIESHAYAPVPAPEVPAAPPAEAAPARRRFARPNGADARSLSDALAGAFGGIEAPAPPPYTNGGPVHGVGSMPAMDSPFALAEAPVAGVRPTALPQSPFTPPATDSPFALAEETLTQAAAAVAPQPAPFTFLKPLGDHFAPIAGAPMPAAATAAAAYDALDDTPLPWMQPVGGRR